MARLPHPVSMKACTPSRKVELAGPQHLSVVRTDVSEYQQHHEFRAINRPLPKGELK
ncbi:hypothetical protein [Streptomyces sp. S.PB5]|uniref:hypothetical protein n=1 Tax=Streptomyces sp. S.PB5 TaxID=3020844 RepID=UPI0025B228BC|nr:hypothetical protein [Streptomyces sp. S.PB5]MDN3024998.1 hypothetical protein [Streptomyces sp. S.PB5]